MDDIIDIGTGRTILGEVRDKKYPSLRRTTYGYALVLLYNMADTESEADKLRAVPRVLDSLIDFRTCIHSRRILDERGIFSSGGGGLTKES